MSRLEELNEVQEGLYEDRMTIFERLSYLKKKEEKERDIIFRVLLSMLEEKLKEKSP